MAGESLVMGDFNNKKCFEYHHLVTFDDTNSAGNVYFAKYFTWMGKCREVITAEHYPEITDDLKNGFGFATEYAHIDYVNESFLFNKVIVKLYIKDLSRTRIEFFFEFVNADSQEMLATGSQAVVWVNPQHRPSLMPDKLYDSALEYFELDDE